MIIFEGSKQLKKNHEFDGDREKRHVQLGLWEPGSQGYRIED